MNMIDFKTLNVGTRSDSCGPCQDRNTLQVLMLGYMNAEALEKTQTSGLVTFFSRSRQELYGQKGRPAAIICIWSPSPLTAIRTLFLSAPFLTGRSATKARRPVGGTPCLPVSVLSASFESVIKGRYERMPRSPTPHPCSRPGSREWRRRSVRKPSRP